MAGPGRGWGEGQHCTDLSPPSVVAVKWPGHPGAGWEHQGWQAGKGFSCFLARTNGRLAKGSSAKRLPLHQALRSLTSDSVGEVGGGLVGVCCISDWGETRPPGGVWGGEGGLLVFFSTLS